MYHARELAMTRMEAEAAALGADGIVGVRLEIEFKEFGTDLAEFIAVGTAVQADEAHAKTPDGFSWRNNKGQPFTSDLSGQDFWTLLAAGYAPLGHDDGHLRLSHRPSADDPEDGQAGRNVEIPQFTEALYDARELAMSRMQAEAEALGAEGIVGVQLRSLAARLGWSHDRVLRDRHRGPSDPRGPRDRDRRSSCCRCRTDRTDDHRRPLARPAGRDPHRRPGRRASLARVLTGALADALPAGIVDVEYDRIDGRSMHGRPGRPAAITVDVRRQLLRMAQDGRGEPQPQIAHTVRGVVISRRPTSVAEWVRTLARRSPNGRSRMRRPVRCCPDCCWADRRWLTSSWRPGYWPASRRSRAAG